MIKDNNSLFQRVHFYDNKTLPKAKSLSSYNIIISDTDKSLDKTKFKSNAIIAYLKGKSLILI